MKYDVHFAKMRRDGDDKGREKQEEMQMNERITKDMRYSAVLPYQTIKGMMIDMIHEEEKVYIPWKGKKNVDKEPRCFRKGGVLITYLQRKLLTKKVF